MSASVTSLAWAAPATIRAAAIRVIANGFSLFCSFGSLNVSFEKVLKRDPGSHLPARQTTQHCPCARAVPKARQRLKNANPGRIPDRKREVGSGRKASGWKIAIVLSARAHPASFPPTAPSWSTRSRTGRQMSRPNRAASLGAIPATCLPLKRNPCRQGSGCFDSGQCKLVAQLLQRLPPNRANRHRRSPSRAE
jgi:hypothetical protein